jgi:hypothetical protein
VGRFGYAGAGGSKGAPVRGGPGGVLPDAGPERWSDRGNTVRQLYC